MHEILPTIEGLPYLWGFSGAWDWRFEWSRDDLYVVELRGVAEFAPDQIECAFGA